MRARIAKQVHKPMRARHFTIAVSEKLERIGCDPIVLLAMYALGDAVTLGLMTKAEYEADAELVCDKGTTYVVKSSGISRAAVLIPPALRAKCAMELAKYVLPKRSAV